jgi:hypothetical protein
MKQILASVDPNAQADQDDGKDSITQPNINVTKNNNQPAPSVSNPHMDRLKSFYSKPIPKPDVGWFNKIKNKFLGDINKT